MNKKQIAALVENMVATIVERDGVSEEIARTLIGLSITKNQEALTQVSVPNLAVSARVAAPDPAAEGLAA